MGRFNIKLAFIIFAFGFSCMSNSYGQDNTNVSEYNVVKWNPISLSRATLTFAYERVLNNHLSLVGTVNFTGFSVNASSNKTISGKESISGIGFVPELRYYATYKKNSAPKGFFVGPFLRYQVGSLKGQDSSHNSVEYDATRLTIGGDLGYQFILGHSISLELFGGPAYEIISVSANSNNPDINVYNIGSAGYTGIGFRLGFTVGVAF